MSRRKCVGEDESEEIGRFRWVREEELREEELRKEDLGEDELREK